MRRRRASRGPGQRVTAPGDEGLALTGESGHGGGGSEGTRDGSAPEEAPGGEGCAGSGR